MMTTIMMFTCKSSKEFGLTPVQKPNMSILYLWFWKVAWKFVAAWSTSNSESCNISTSSWASATALNRLSLKKEGWFCFCATYEVYTFSYKYSWTRWTVPIANGRWSSLVAGQDWGWGAGQDLYLHVTHLNLNLNLNVTSMSCLAPFPNKITTQIWAKTRLFTSKYMNNQGKLSKMWFSCDILTKNNYLEAYKQHQSYFVDIYFRFRLTLAFPPQIYLQNAFRMAIYSLFPHSARR